MARSGETTSYNDPNGLFLQRKEPKMARNEKTSKGVASKASKLLSKSSTPKNVKSVAASALTQAPDKKRGGKGGRKKGK